MLYRIGVAVLTLMCTAVAIGLQTAGADPVVGEKDNGLSICEERYLALYEEAQAEFGSGAVGANVVDDGMGEHEAYALPESVCEQKAATLDAMLHPPEPVQDEVSYLEGDGTSTPEPVASEATYATTGNSTVMCESGGDYAANTGNGYYGGYQFDSGTWDAYGDPAYGEANEAPPAVQDAAAASVPYDAWPNC